MKNDIFLTDRPDLLAGWAHEMNTHLDPSSLTIHSTKKAWWKCSLGHFYEQHVYVHARGSGCPYCAHRKVLAGFNDLASQYPNLAFQMDRKKNSDLSPDMIMARSNKKVWWKCDLGHSWEASPNSRSTGDGCPYCSNHRVLAGFNDLTINYPEIASEWDKDKNKDLTPSMVTAGSSKRVWWKCPKGHSYDATVSSRTSNGLNCPVCSGRRVIAGVNDLATTYPQIAAEWNYEKNGTLTPEQVMAGSDKRVWWKCDLGHSWKTRVSNRIHGRNCPFCSNRKVLPGFNDALSRYPIIGAYWDHEKNMPLEPSKIMPSYIRHKIWWKCNDGHSWQMLLPSFLKLPGCPFCEGRRKLERRVYLSDGYPDIASEWDFEKNGTLSPDKVLAGSKLEVWWRCPLGHSYRKRISRRVFRSSCPYCSGWSLLPGFNDLATLYPDIAAEWDYEKNRPLTPSETYRATSRKVWWLCPQGHSYCSTVAARTSFNEGCPYCLNRKVIAGINDLETLFPDVAMQWDFEKNYPLLPNHVVAKSSKRVWWKCEKGHSWDTVIANRTIRRTGCPYCSGLRVSSGETDFATLNPSLLSEWDYEKNGSISPSELSSQSTYIAWWKCVKGHSWQSPLYSRTAGENCPFCQSVKPYYSHLI